MTIMTLAAVLGLLVLATGWAAIKMAADDELDELRAQAEHRRKVDSLARIHIDVGRQRPIQPEAAFTLAGKDTDCVRDDCARQADTNSDFCTPCRTDLMGGVA